MTGLSGIIRSYKDRRIESATEMADYLDVTEEFLIEALNCYKSKYGQCVRSGVIILCLDHWLLLKIRSNRFGVLMIFTNFKGEKTETMASMIGAISGFKYADSNAEFYEYDETSDTYQALASGDVSQELIDAFNSFK